MKNTTSKYLTSTCRPFITSTEVNEATGPHTGNRLWALGKEKIEKKITKKSVPPQTYHDIHSSPATAPASIRRATKYVPRVPILACFHRSRVCGNRPRTALAISKKFRVVVGIFPAVKLPPWWAVPVIWRFTAIFW